MLVERVYGLTPVPEWIAAYEEINQFERTLADDGTIILKFWLHISKEEQLRRFVALAQQEATAWQVTAEDWENHRRYDEFVAAVRDMLANTSTPWRLGGDRRRQPPALHVQRLPRPIPAAGN